jgi:hypothetical protein
VLIIPATGPMPRIQGPSALVSTVRRVQSRWVTLQPLERAPRLGATHLDRLAALDVAVKAATAPQFPEVDHWWVSAVGGCVKLRAATHIACLPAPAQRLTRIAAGTALLAARLAMAAAGVRSYTMLAPDAHRPALLALLQPAAAAEPTPAERALYHALAWPEPPWPGRRVGPALPLLRRAADAEGAWLCTVCDPLDRSRILAAASHESEPVSDSVLLMLGSPGGGPVGEIRVGLALRRVLLTAQALGLGGMVLAGPVELSEERLRDLRGVGGRQMPPQILLAVGAHPHAELEASPRTAALGRPPASTRSARSRTHRPAGARSLTHRSAPTRRGPGGRR